MRLLKRQDYHKSLWKNKGGETHDIASFPAELSGPESSFDWRISLADVISNGPYSSFPGYDRILTQISDNGSRLVFEDGRIFETQFAKSFHFSGNEMINASLLDDAAQNFNVMVRRGVCRATVDCLSVSSEPQFFSRQEENVLLICNLSRSVVSVQPVDGTTLFLEYHDCLLVEESLQVKADEGFSLLSDETSILAFVRLSRC